MTYLQVAPQDNFAPPCLQRLWQWVLFVCVTLTLHAVVYAARSERISTALAALLVLIAGITLVVLVAAILLTPARIERVQCRMSPYPLIVMPLLAATLFLVGLGMRAEWFYAHIALTIVLTAVCVSITLYPTFNLLSHPWLWGLLSVGFVLTVGIRLYGLSVYPGLHSTDEGWTLSWAVSVLRHGYVSDMLARDLDGTPTYWLARYYAVLGLWLRLLGVGLWQARLFSVLISGLVVLFTALASRNLYGRKAALLTAAFMAVSPLLALGFRIRHDVGVALAIACSLWLYSRATQNNRPVLHFLAGIAVAFGTFAHYHALLLAPAIFLGIYLPRYFHFWHSGRRFPEAAAWLYGCGMVLGFAIVAGVQILPDIASFLANQSPQRPLTLDQWLQTLFAQLAEIAQISRWDALLIIGALVAALKWRVPNRWLVLSLFVWTHLALATVTHYASDYYLVPLVPVYGLLVGRFLSQIDSAIIGQRGIAVVTLFLLMPGLGLVTKTPFNAVRTGAPIALPPPPAAEWVKVNVSTDETILAETYYYLWLYDYPFVSHQHGLNNWTELNPMLPGAPPWDTYGIDVVIIDPNLTGHTLLNEFVESGWLDAHGFTLAAEVSGQRKPVRIYRRSP